MATSHRRTLLGSIITLVGLVFLEFASSQVQTAFRNIQEFSFCVACYLGFACAVAFGTLGICGTVTGVVILRWVRR